MGFIQFFSISRKIISLLISNHVFKIDLHLINAQGNRLEYCVFLALATSLHLLDHINLYKDGAMINVK